MWKGCEILSLVGFGYIVSVGEYEKYWRRRKEDGNLSTLTYRLCLILAHSLITHINYS